MKIYVRSLTNQKYELEVSPSDTVAAVKQAIHHTHNLGEPDSQKLIFAGKILQDEQTLDEAKVKEGGFLVLMIKKEKTAPATAKKPAEPTPAPATATATATPATATATAPVQQPASTPAPAAASALVTVIISFQSFVE
jgi:UV excision repair protein RAD23